MFCETCGTKNREENRFCQNCGNRLEQTPQPDEGRPLSHIGFTPPADQPVPVTQPDPDLPVTLAEWLGVFCLNLIPVMGPVVFFVMLFVWAFGSTKKPSLKNFARAVLLFLAILLGIGLLLLIVYVLASIFSLLPGYFF